MSWHLIAGPMLYLGLGALYARLRWRMWRAAVPRHHWYSQTYTWGEKLMFPTSAVRWRIGSVDIGHSFDDFAPGIARAFYWHHEEHEPMAMVYWMTVESVFWLPLVSLRTLDFALFFILLPLPGHLVRIIRACTARFVGE